MQFVWRTCTEASEVVKAYKAGLAQKAENTYPGGAHSELYGDVRLPTASGEGKEQPPSPAVALVCTSAQLLQVALVLVPADHAALDKVVADALPGSTRECFNSPVAMPDGLVQFGLAKFIDTTVPTLHVAIKLEVFTDDFAALRQSFNPLER